MVRRQQAADRAVRKRMRSPGHPPLPRDFALARNQVYGDYRHELLLRIGDREFKYLEDKADIHINRAYQP